MASTTVFGYTVEDIEGSPDSVKIDLREDGEVILTREDADLAESSATDSDSYRQNVLAAKGAKADEWAMERGPDSELGRNMEAGTPSTDHGGDSPRESNTSVPPEHPQL